MSPNAQGQLHTGTGPCRSATSRMTPKWGGPYNPRLPYTSTMNGAQRGPGTGRVAGVAFTIPAVLALSACAGLPFGGGGGAVTFDGVQSATIQIEAQGTFVSPEEGGFESAGLGSGFIITPEGLAVTNNHVVAGAGTLKVWRGGDTSNELGAKVLGSSECLDLAVIQLAKGTYPFLEWREDEIKAATDVWVAGFPLGDPTFTITKGIISKVSTDGQTSWASIDSVIEHDARQHPGNSGGPLVDSAGKLVGVTYSGIADIDYSFAIPRDEVLDVISDLVDGKSVLSLGINGEAITDADGNGLGVWVNSVSSGSTADKAGVEPGDLLTRMEGVSIGGNGTLTEYCDVLRTHGQDATLSVELYRSADETYYRGQFNGDPVEAITDVGGSGSEKPSGEYVTVQDDSGTVFVDVPAAWSDLDGASDTDDAGFIYPAISASPNLSDYFSSWGTSGVDVYASQEAAATVTPDVLMDNASLDLPAAGCVSNGRQPYDDGFHVGSSELWEGCGGSATYLVIGATSYAGDYVALVTAIAATDADLPVFDRISASFFASF